MTTEQSVFASKSDTSDKSQNDTLKIVDNVKPEIFLFKKYRMQRKLQ